jgi:hypothetical protein
MPDEDININVENNNSSEPTPPVEPAPTPPSVQPIPPPVPQPEATILSDQPAEASSEPVMEVPPQVMQTQTPETTQTLRADPKKGSSVFKIIFGLVAFLALIGVGVWAYLNFVVAPATSENVEVTIPPVVTTPQSTMSVFSIDKELDEMENDLTDLETELETEFDLDIEIPAF